MRTRTNMPQMKEQNKTTGKELNKTEITNLLDAELKNWLSGCSKLINYGNRIKKSQEEMKDTRTEINRNLQGTNTGGDEAVIQLKDLEHKEEISI